MSPTDPVEQALSVAVNKAEDILVRWNQLPAQSVVAQHGFSADSLFELSIAGGSQ